MVVFCLEVYIENTYLGIRNRPVRYGIKFLESFLCNIGNSSDHLSSAVGGLLIRCIKVRNTVTLFKQCKSSTISSTITLFLNDFTLEEPPCFLCADFQLDGIASIRLIYCKCLIESRCFFPIIDSNLADFHCDIGLL